MKTILIWCMLDNMFWQYDIYPKWELGFEVATKVEDIRDQLMYQLALQFGMCSYPSYETFVEYIKDKFSDVVKWDDEKENWIDIYTGGAL